MATISENQRKYLTNMMNGTTETGAASTPGQQAWAKAQLAKAPAAAPTAPAVSPAINTTQQVTSSPQVQAYTNAMMGNGAGAAGRIEMPVTRANQTIDQYQQAVSTPWQYNQNEDPAYHAAIAAAQQNIQQQQADTNARLRASGQGKSSYSESVANQIGAQEMGRVSREVLPQLISQAYMRDQDRLANMQKLYAMQNEQDFTNRITEAGLTGTYKPDEAQQYINALVNYKADTEANWANMTAEQRAAARQEGDRVRMILQGMGIDPSLYGADVTADTARSNIGQGGIRTLAGREQDYNMSADQRNYDRSVLESDRNYDRSVMESDRNFGFQKAQQEWENQFRQAQFDESKAARIWEQAFQEKSFAQSVQDAAASRGLQWASLNQREKEFVADQAFREKQFQFEQTKFDAQQSAPANYDYRADPSFADDIAFINADPVNAITDVRANAQALIQQYGYNGYTELLRAAEAAVPKDSNQYTVNGFALPRP